MFGKKKPKRLYYPTGKKWYTQPRRKSRTSRSRKVFTHNIRTHFTRLFKNALYFTITGLIFVDNLIAKIILILVFGFGLSAIFTITFSLGIEVNKKYAGSVSGLLMAMAYPGVIVFQYISGYMLENLSANSVLILDTVLVFFLLVSVVVLNYRGIFKRRNWYIAYLAHILSV